MKYRSAIIRKKILSALELLYPETRSELDFKNEYELIVAVTLSAQCTDKKVNQTTPELFRRFNSFAALQLAQLAEVETILRPINYFRNKSKNIIAMAEIVTKKHDGTLPKTMPELIELPGVGRKTASVILGELGFEQTLPVDTHVFRVSKRLGFSDGANVVAVESDLRRQFAPDTWRGLHHRLIFHGRRVCKAQRPLCELCSLARMCPSSRNWGATQVKRRS